MAATIDWGDGSASIGTVVAGTVGASHTYAATGSLPLLVTLLDDRGVVATVGGAANVVAGSNRFVRGKLLVNRKEGTAILPVRLPGPGALRFGGAGVAVRPLTGARASGVTNVDSAETIRLLVRARGEARRRLEGSSVVTVTVAVTFTPVAGTPRRQSTRISSAGALSRGPQRANEPAVRAWPPGWRKAGSRGTAPPSGPGGAGQSARSPRARPGGRASRASASSRRS